MTPYQLARWKWLENSTLVKIIYKQKNQKPKLKLNKTSDQTLLIYIIVVYVTYILESRQAMVILE